MELVQKEYRDSHIMLFCALILMKNHNVTLEQTSTLVPFSGHAERLVRALSKPNGRARAAANHPPH